jgi:hypothetical protein
MNRLVYRLLDALQENVDVRRYLFFYFVYANEKRFGPFLSFNHAVRLAKTLAGLELKEI